MKKSEVKYELKAYVPGQGWEKVDTKTAVTRKDYINLATSLSKVGVQAVVYQVTTVVYRDRAFQNWEESEE